MNRIEREYRDALDALRFSDEAKERMMDNLMEEKEEKPMKKRNIRPLRTGLIAACVCLALVGSAFAASPGLREMLSAALGGFAPYAQTQEDKIYTIDGLEFQVRSVLADDFSIRAYVEARDPEGDIFSKIDDIMIPGRVDGEVKVPFIYEWLSREATESWLVGTECLGYDEESRTALLVVSTWKAMPENLTSASVLMWNIVSYQTGAHEEVWRNEKMRTIPVEVKPVESTVLGKDTALVSALDAEEARLSPLGLTLIFHDYEIHRTALEAAGSIWAKLADGSIVEVPKGGLCGIFLPPYEENSSRVLIWNFREPVEAEQIEGIYVGEDYFPVK